MENSYTKFVENQEELTRKLIQKDKNVNEIVLKWWKDTKDLDRILLKQGVKFFTCNDKELDKIEKNIINFIDNYYLELFDNKIYLKSQKDRISINERNELFNKSKLNYKVTFDQTQIYNALECVDESFHIVTLSYNITTSETFLKFYFQTLFK